MTVNIPYDCMETRYGSNLLDSKYELYSHIKPEPKTVAHQTYFHVPPVGYGLTFENNILLVPFKFHRNLHLRIATCW